MASMPTPMQRSAGACDVAELKTLGTQLGGGARTSGIAFIDEEARAGVFVVLSGTRALPSLVREDRKSVV